MLMVLHFLAAAFMIAAICLMSSSIDRGRYRFIPIQLLVILVNMFMFFNMDW